MKIDINLIDSNPYRNFNVNPITDERVDTLIESFEKNGDFGALPVRPFGDRYQLACGHHRVAAMKKLGYDDIRVIIDNYDNNQMVHIMIDENLKQYGNNPTSIIDAVCSVTKLAAEILLTNTWDDWFLSHGGGTNELFSDERSFNRCLGHLRAGSGLGSPFIQRFVGDSINATNVDFALKSLNASGEIKNIVSAIDAEYTAKLEKLAEEKRLAAEAAEAEKKRIAEAEIETKRLAAEAEKREIKRAAAIREAAKRKRAEDEAAAKRKRAEDEAAAKRKNEENARIQKRAEAKLAEDEKQKSLDAAKKLSEMAAKNAPEKTVDGRISGLFSVPGHLRAFQVAFSPDAKSDCPVVPFEQQYDFTVEVLRRASHTRCDISGKLTDDGSDHLTAARITEETKLLLAEGKNWQRAEIKKQQVISVTGMNDTQKITRAEKKLISLLKTIQGELNEYNELRLNTPGESGLDTVFLRGALYSAGVKMIKLGNNLHAVDTAAIHTEEKIDIDSLLTGTTRAWQTDFNTLIKTQEN